MTSETLTPQAVAAELDSLCGQWDQADSADFETLLVSLRSLTDREWTESIQEVRELVSLMSDGVHELLLSCDSDQAPAVDPARWRSVFEGLSNAVQTDRSEATSREALRSQIEELVDELRQPTASRLESVWGNADGDWSAADDSDDLNTDGAGPADDVPAMTVEQIDELLSAVGRLTSTEQSSSSAATPAAQARPAEQSGKRPEPLAAIFDHVAIDPELQDAYLDDAGQCLSSMEQAVLSSPGVIDSNTARKLCRDLHTLKGASASVGLGALAEYLHQTEDWLQTQTAGANVELNDVLEVVDVIREHISVIQSSEHEAACSDVGENAIENPRLDLSSVQSGESQGQTDTLRVRAAQLDRLLDMLAELVMLRNRRDSTVNRLKGIHEEMTGCLGRLRTVIEVTPAERDCLVLERGTVEGSRRGELPYAGGQRNVQLAEIANDFSELHRNLRELFEPVAEDNRLISQFTRQFRQELMQLRRLPLSGLFQRLQRATHDAARTEQRRVRLEHIGSQAGLERAIQERIYEPLLHLVRNAVSHGIESPEERRAAGKPEEGVITLEAIAGSQLLILEIRDDGRGLDYDRIRQRGIERGLLRVDRPATSRELSQLIFHPGFSTRTEANAVSGRGVGMDVVRAAMDRLHARIEVESEPGRGMTVRLMIPMRNVIEHTMLFRCGGQLLALPMQFIKSASNQQASGRSDVRAQLQGLRQLSVGMILGLKTQDDLASCSYLTVADRRRSNSDAKAAAAGTEDVAILVDEILGPEEVVVRPLPSLLKGHPLYAGATLSGAGEVVLLLDSHALMQSAANYRRAATEIETSTASPAASNVAHRAQGLSVLVVDDSISARRSLMKRLRSLSGSTALDIEEASDGLMALEKLRRRDYDLVFSDLEMPRLGGLDLLAEVRSLPRRVTAQLVVVSSRNEPAVREQVARLGAQAFLAKPADEESLRNTLLNLGFPHFDVTSPEVSS